MSIFDHAYKIWKSFKVSVSVLGELCFLLIYSWFNEFSELLFSQCCNCKNQTRESHNNVSHPLSRRVSEGSIFREKWMDVHTLFSKINYIWESQSWYLRYFDMHDFVTINEPTLNCQLFLLFPSLHYVCNIVVIYVCFIR